MSKNYPSLLLHPPILRCFPLIFGEAQRREAKEAFSFSDMLVNTSYYVGLLCLGQATPLTGTKSSLSGLEVTWAKLPAFRTSPAMQSTSSHFSCTHPAVRQRCQCFSINSTSSPPSPKKRRTKCPGTSTLKTVCAEVQLCGCKPNRKSEHKTEEWV